MELRIAKVENVGKKLILDDKSEWEIIYFDSLKSMKWLPSQVVIVREKKDMDSWTVYTNTVYPYTTIIEHVDSGKMVGAMRVN